MIRADAVRTALIAAPVIVVALAIILILARAPNGGAPEAITASGSPSASAEARTRDQPQRSPLPVGTYYVATDGDDRAAGTRSRPWQTLQQAAEVARGEVVISGGNYAGFRFTRAGVDFRAAPGEEVVVMGPVELVEASEVTLRGLVFEGVTGPYEAALLLDRARSIMIIESIVRDSTFGLQLRDVEDVTIERSEFRGNGTGIEIHGIARSVTIEQNEIHHNDRAVDSSRGANGIALYRASGPVVIMNNRLWANYNPSPPPDTDAGGGAIELFASSDVRVEGNEIWDNSVLETGTEEGIACSQLVFVRNLAYRGSAPTVQDGLVLRCAEDSLVAHNTLDGLDRFAFDVIHLAGPFGGSVEGLRIINNIAVNGRAYGIDNELPSSVEIDHNLTWNPSSDAEHGEFLAYVAGRGNTTSFADMQSWGLDRNGIHADPRFADQGARDYRLQPDSPAIGRAARIEELPVSDDPDGPDLGRWQH